MKGKKVTEGTILVNFNSKIKPETKDVIDAVIAIGAVGSNREFLERAVELYKGAYPQEWEKAVQYLKLTGKINNF